MTRLGQDDYKKPKTTYQETLSSKEINEQLKNYRKVENFKEIDIKTHIKYFTVMPNGKKKFRVGGYLKNKENSDKYIVLESNGKSWSVDVKKNIIFYKSKEEEIKNDPYVTELNDNFEGLQKDFNVKSAKYEKAKEIISQKNDEIELLKNELKKLKKMIKK